MSADTSWLLGPGTCKTREIEPYSRSGDKAPLLRKLEVLRDTGVVSFPFITETVRKEMLAEAQGLTYIQRRSERRGGLFHEVCESHRLPLGEILVRFSIQYTLKLLASLAPLRPEEYFSTELRPNDVCVQRHNEKSLRIWNDRDGQSDINLVSIFILGGEADLTIFDDREGTNPQQIDTTPGNAILMRANGFCGCENTPIHRISNVRSDCYVLSVRQRV